MAAPKRATTKKRVTRPGAAKKAAQAKKPEPGTAASGATKVGGKPAAPPIRFVFPMATYEPEKDAIKAPLKKLGLKWQYLGTGKGRYFGNGINVFCQFDDVGAHFTLRTHDAKMKKAILAVWKTYPNIAEAAEEIESAKATDASTREWELAKPAPRAGEPEFFFKKRLAEWEALDPRKKR